LKLFPDREIFFSSDFPEQHVADYGLLSLEVEFVHALFDFEFDASLYIFEDADSDVFENRTQLLF